MQMSVIGRTVFELETSSVPLARAAQEAVSRFARAALAESLDAAVLAAAPAGPALRYGTITLELGELRLDRLEHALGPRLEAALRSFLEGQRGLPWMPPQSGAAEPEPLVRLAAWLHGAATPDLAALLRSALALPHAAAVVRRYGRRHAARRRLAALAAPQIAALLRCLEPEQAATVLAVVTGVAAAHRQRPLVPAARAEFGLALWEFVFSYLLLERGSYFNTRALAAHLLAGIASRYRISYGTLLAALVAVATRPGLPQARGVSLPLLLLDLHGAVPAPPPPPAPAPLSALAHVLRHGVLAPAPAGVAVLGLGALLDAAMAERPDALRALLRTLGQQAAVRTRLAAQAGAERLRALVLIVEPGHGPWVVATVEAVQAVQDTQRLAPEDGRRFGTRLWSVVLQILLAERGSHFNTRAFVRRLIEATAAATGRRYGDWLLALAAGGAWLAGTGRRPRLARVLDELRREQQAQDDAQDDAQDGAQDGAQDDAQHGAQDDAQDAAAGARLAARALLVRAGPGRGAARADLRALVQRLARRHGIDVHALLAELARAGGSLALAARDGQALRALLESLHAEWLDASRAGPAPPAAGAVAHGAPTAGLARAVREFAVRSLVLERGSWFNDRSYVEGLVRQLAHRHGLGYGDLLATLVAAVSGPALAARDGPLPAVLLALQAQRPADAPGWQFLLNGRLDHGAGWRRVLARGPALAGLEAAPAALRADRSGALARRLADYLAPPALRLLLAALVPAWAGALATVLEAGGDQPDDWGAALALLAAPGPVPDLHGWLAAFGARRAAAVPHAYWGRLWRTAAARRGEARFAALADLCETQLRRAGAAPPALAPARALRPVWPAAAPSPVLAAALARLLRLGLHAWRDAWEEAPPARTLFTLLAARMAAEPRAFLPVLRAACARPLERARLARLLPEALRAALLRSLLGGGASAALWWRARLAAGLHALAPRVAAQSWLHTVDAHLLCHLAGRRRPELAAWLRAVGRQAWLDAQLDWPRLLAEWQRQAAAARAAEGRAARRLLAHLAQQPAPGAIAPPPAATSIGETLIGDMPIGDMPIEDMPIEDTPIEIGNAGLVLLWPFLGRLCECLELSAGGVFRDTAAQMRAVYLFDFLVWGRWDAPEEELALPKILCGMALETPLEPSPGPSAAERALCESMCAAALAHWGRLGNTGTEGLQQTFLQRAGQLRRKDGNWHLRVPERPFDVLLTTLPWALGTVRLSWMKEILWVSWK